MRLVLCRVPARSDGLDFTETNDFCRSRVGPPSQRNLVHPIACQTLQESILRRAEVASSVKQLSGRSTQRTCSLRNLGRKVIGIYRRMRLKTRKIVGAVLKAMQVTSLGVHNVQGCSWGNVGVRSTTGTRSHCHSKKFVACPLFFG